MKVLRKIYNNLLSEAEHTSAWMVPTWWILFILTSLPAIASMIMISISNSIAWLALLIPFFAFGGFALYASGKAIKEGKIKTP